jgi:CdiI N-terminal domain
MMHNSDGSLPDKDERFRIEFSDEASAGMTVPDGEATGILQLGPHVERFIAELSFWTRSEYQLHWERQLVSIVDKTLRGGLITSMDDPGTAKFIEWWPMWREDSTIFFQNQLLFLDQLLEPFDPYDAARSVGVRKTTSSDGAAISQWNVHVDSIRQFLAILKRAP